MWYTAYNFPHWNLNNNKINKKFDNLFTISTHLARCQLEVREWSTNFPTVPYIYKGSITNKLFKIDVFYRWPYYKIVVTNCLLERKDCWAKCASIKEIGHFWLGFYLLAQLHLWWIVVYFLLPFVVFLCAHPKVCPIDVYILVKSLYFL